MSEPSRTPGSHTRKTYFAPAGRADPDVVQRAIDYAIENPIINTVLASFSGIVAVLNEQRQCVAVNDTLLDLLDLPDASTILGLRTGEVIDCIHAEDDPDGCGTTPFCSSCGAAIATVTCQQTGRPIERDCVVSVRRAGAVQDLYLRVRAAPIELEDQRFVLLYIRDMSVEMQWASLERAFFHDISNTITSLSGAAKEIGSAASVANGASRASTAASSSSRDNTATTGSGAAFDAIAQVRHLTQRLAKEVEIQKTLLNVQTGSYLLETTEFRLGALLRELRSRFARHPSARKKTIELPDGRRNLRLRTDYTLLSRVLTNMVLNAIEATDRGRSARMWVERSGNTVEFNVWNHRTIRDATARRVFQRNFSTKTGTGRGLGTYSMKLFGERYLGGTVGFTTGPGEGTVFQLSLPNQPRDE